MSLFGKGLDFKCNNINLNIPDPNVRLLMPALPDRRGNSQIKNGDDSVFQKGKAIGKKCQLIINFFFIVDQTYPE